MTSKYDYDSSDGGGNEYSIRRCTTTSVFENNSHRTESSNENNSNNNSNNNNNPSDNTSNRIPPKKRRFRNSEMNDGIGSDFIALNDDKVGEVNQSLPGSIETATKGHQKNILRLQEEILLLESSISNLNQRRFEKNYHLMQELEKGKRLYEEMTHLRKEYKQLCQKKKRQSNVYQRIQNSMEANQIRYKRLQSIKVDGNDNDVTIKEIQQLVHDTSSVDDIESTKTNIPYSTANVFTGSESSTIIDGIGRGYSEDID